MEQQVKLYRTVETAVSGITEELAQKWFVSHVVDSPTGQILVVFERETHSVKR